MTKRATPFCTRDYVHSPEDLLCKPQFRRLRAISLLLFVACSDGQPVELPNKIPLLDRERFKSSTVSEDVFNGLFDSVVVHQLSECPLEAENAVRTMPDTEEGREYALKGAG